MRTASVLLIVSVAVCGTVIAACESDERTGTGSSSSGQPTGALPPGGDGGSCATPVAECSTLCTELCDKLAGCGRAASDCRSACELAYRCPGETPGHDTSICSSRRQRVSSGECAALCDETWDSNTFRPCGADAG